MSFFCVKKAGMDNVIPTGHGPAAIPIGRAGGPTGFTMRSAQHLGIAPAATADRGGRQERPTVPKIAAAFGAVQETGTLLADRRLHAWDLGARVLRGGLSNHCITENLII